jgi:hypothetical protein
VKNSSLYVNVFRVEAAGGFMSCVVIVDPLLVSIVALPIGIYLFNYTRDPSHIQQNTTK